MRELNRAAVLAELLRSRPASRKQIASRTGVSPATVTRATDQLIHEGIVREGDEIVVENRGRRARALDLVAERSYAVGIDLGASNTRLVMTDLVGAPQIAVETKTPSQLSSQEMASWLAREVIDAAAAAGVWSAVAHISLGLPGAVGQGDRVVSNAPNLPHVEDVRFLEVLERELGMTLEVDNDANFALLGEQRFGSARDAPTAAMLTLGTGLGAGLAIDGWILQGRHGLIGEFGQLPIGAHGLHLEHFVTGPGLLRRARETGVVLESPADLFSDAQPTSAKSLREEFDHALRVVLTAIAVSCEPEVIVLGGGISRSLESRLSAYQDALEQSLRYAPKLRAVELGNFSGAVGAAVTSLRTMYRELGVHESALVDLPTAQPLDLDSLVAVARAPHAVA
ncbi:ROK family transcriptional regulator [Microbacterium halotolerans]|uniref:ROK family transcriptional regulator n=1 Tax=Microbacterium halotolerans TaxID=246613 RepID=UPI0023E193FB|nr:ROK family transcriptional regulator [Microbacterium halotolerans]